MREQHHDGAAGWRTEMLVELELQSDLRRKDMLGVVKGELGTCRIDSSRSSCVN